MQSLGCTEGANLRVDYRFAAGDKDRLAAASKEPVSLKPDVLLARSTIAVRALLAETRTIGEKFAASLAQPAATPPASPMSKRRSAENGSRSRARPCTTSSRPVFRRSRERSPCPRKGPIGLVVRTIGLAGARVKIGLANLVYNMKRTIWLTGHLAPGIGGWRARSRLFGPLACVTGRSWRRSCAGSSRTGSRLCPRQYLLTF